METVAGLFLALLGTFILSQFHQAARDVFARKMREIRSHDDSTNARIMRKQATRDAGSIF